VFRQLPPEMDMMFASCNGFRKENTYSSDKIFFNNISCCFIGGKLMGCSSTRDKEKEHCKK
jgi:hypothetical protein